MEECPFLSTFESDVECFKECALYNYGGTGGICPFKKLDGFSGIRLEKRKNDLERFEGELDFIKKFYIRN